ncbi:MAG TPA: hypothetical protein VFV38_40175 [Ktedonobacteraceae bacterium]|nr:hypothetical protein [Ktedonobacteraceae bacterium]
MSRPTSFRWLRPFTIPWWIAGGWALDLFLGVQTREHEDLDVLFLRRDHHEIRARLQGWDVQEAYPELLPGSLSLFPGSCRFVRPPFCRGLSPSELEEKNGSQRFWTVVS